MGTQAQAVGAPSNGRPPRSAWRRRFLVAFELAFLGVIVAVGVAAFTGAGGLPRPRVSFLLLAGGFFLLSRAARGVRYAAFVGIPLASRQGWIAINVVLLSTAANFIGPKFQIPGRAIYSKRYLGMPVATSVLATTTELIVDLLFPLLFGLIGLVSLWFFYEAPDQVYFVGLGALVGGGLALALFLSALRPRGLHLAERFLRPLMFGPLRRRFDQVMVHVHSAGTTLWGAPGRAKALIVWSFVASALDLLYYFFALNALGGLGSGVAESATLSGVVYAFVTFYGNFLSILPGAVGTMEGAILVATTAAGVDLTGAIGLAAALRTAQIAAVAIGGLTSFTVLRLQEKGAPAANQRERDEQERKGRQEQEPAKHD